jgi:hypothetical protein
MQTTRSTAAAAVTALLALTACERPTVERETAVGPITPAATARTTVAAPADPAKDLRVDCDGPFRRSMAVADLERMFGKASLSHGDLPGPEGTSTPATFVFARDAERKLVVIWRDAEARQGIDSVQVDDGSGGAWTGPSGLRSDADLATVAAANGKPVKLYGFSWDYGGTVSDWNGGAFDRGRPTCSVFVRFDSDQAGDAVGDSEFAASDARMVAAKPKVASWGINFISPDEEG